MINVVMVNVNDLIKCIGTCWKRKEYAMRRKHCKTRPMLKKLALCIHYEHPSLPSPNPLKLVRNP